MSLAEDQPYFGLEDLVLKEENLRRGIWVTKDDKHIPISEMSLQHLKNSLRLIYKNKWREEYKEIIENEIRKRTKI